MSDGAGFEFVDAVTSDIQFRAWGATPEDGFRAAADALLAATVEDPDASVRASEEREIALAEPDLDLLLLRFLNELVYLRDAEELLLRVRTLRLGRGAGGGSGDGEEATLEAVLVGERIARSRHRLLADVKAATAHGLRVAPAEPPGAGWEVRATLDV